MHILLEIIRNHKIYFKQIINLAKSDVVKTYKGAALGWLWALIQPTITIAIYYFAFTVGLRSGGDVNGYPFFLWLIAGIVPWFYITNSITAGAGSIRNYRYLVTKIKYPVCTIPTFVNLSKFSINIFLQILVMLIFCGFGYTPDIYWLQIPLYGCIMYLFFTTFSLFTAMVSCISLDFLHLLRSITMALFWLSGVLYEVSKIQIPWVKFILNLNPITLILKGYRDSFIYKQWFWESPQTMIIILIEYVLILAIAVFTYKKLKHVIPDIL